MLPGHGEEFGAAEPGEDAVSPLVAQRLDFYDRRAGQILALVRQGVTTPWEMVRRLFPDLDPGYVFLGVSEVVGHLDLLADRGEVVFEGQEGTWRVELP